MSIATIGLFIAGLVLLIVGAEVLVRGASRLAVAVGISPLVVGLTVVAYGTSAPELAVSVQSSFVGQTDMALGNVVGSNIANVLLILGLSALITPLVVSVQLIRFDVPLMVGTTVIFLLLGMDGAIGRVDGIILFAGAIAYSSWLIIQSRRETKQAQQMFTEVVGDIPAPSPRSWVRDSLMIVGGLAMLVFGSRWLVAGATSFARLFGISELVIGLTVVAVGTSLPEVATSVIASLRGQRDIAVGNVVGSNIFNILSVLGLASIVAPAGITVSAAALRFDIPVMIVVAVACLPIFLTGKVIARWEGGLFFAYYLAYTLYLILHSTGHMMLPLFNTAILGFALPLTAITLLVMTIRALRSRTEDETGDG